MECHVYCFWPDVIKLYIGGNRYLLQIRMAATTEEQDKRGESVMKALKNIFDEERSPSRIRTDKGQEFRS